MINNLKSALVAAVLLISTISFSQHHPDHEKIKALKIAFVTEQLDLSTKEAQSFWPIYNEYQENRDELRRKEKTEIQSKIKAADGLTENQAKDLLEKYISFEDEEELLDKTFLKEVSKVISSKKTLLLLRSEKEFKRKLIKQYREKRGGSGGYR